MPWNWELIKWPKFEFAVEPISRMEKEFLFALGKASAYLSTIGNEEYNRFIVEILSKEGVESSRIEGEILDRESLQSLIRQQFGLQGDRKKRGDKESRMASVLFDVYSTYSEPLTHEMMWKWHSILFQGSSHLDDCGKYRTHAEPMQIVSGRLDSQKVLFEAPSSKIVGDEMERFVQWFNSSKGSTSILGRAAIAHLYFESIHPFEDGNGRIGRILVEKILSQEVGRPVLIAISKCLEKRKREYYAELEKCNRTLYVQHWVDFFASVILEAHAESMELLYFLIAKLKMLASLSGQINSRQMKVLLRMFAEGPEGFKGNLSADNYISITKTTRATASRDLTDLVKKGAFIKSGKLRHTRYQLNLKF